MRHIVLTFAFATSLPCAHAACDFKPTGRYQDTSLARHTQDAAYLFTVRHVKVDADGAPNAYHPDDIPLNCTHGNGFKGLDCPANAGYPGSNWWQSALVPDPANPKKAYIQPPGSEFSGFFVSQTSLTDTTKTKTDPARYVDSRHVPYLVFPGKFRTMAGTGDLGDIGVAIHTTSGARSFFVVAEIGPRDASLGEMSIALAQALGGTDPNPRTGNGTPGGKIAIVVFPRSRTKPAWPLKAGELEARGAELLSGVGGVDMVLSCAKDL